MKLTKIEIFNFRSIKHIELELTDMVALIGQNNVGKSNILKAIDFFTADTPKKDDNLWYMNDTSTPIKIALTFDTPIINNLQTYTKIINKEITDKEKISARYCFGNDEELTTTERKELLQKMPHIYYFPDEQKINDEIKLSGSSNLIQLFNNLITNMSNVRGHHLNGPHDLL